VTRPFFPSLYFVRHATPDWSRTDIPYHLPPGPPLTPQGEREAAQLGEFLRAMGVRQLWHSPLERCARTAAIAAEVAGASLRLDPRLAEIRPEEKPAGVLARIWPVWVEASEASLSGDPLALITHGGPINLLLAELGVAAKDLTHYQNKFDRRNPLPPAGAWRALRPAPDGPWSLGLAYTPTADQKAKAWLV
jgi:broad specificity phosphatase PhoE